MSALLVQRVNPEPPVRRALVDLKVLPDLEGRPDRPDRPVDRVTQEPRESKVHKGQRGVERLMTSPTSVVPLVSLSRASPVATWYAYHSPGYPPGMRTQTATASATLAFRWRP